MEDNTPIILAGNPNVGKSTLFNYLTKLHQHTGNWTGKTVSNTIGICKRTTLPIHLADVPGIYSLSCHTPEEVFARNQIAFTPHKGIVIVCDSSAPLRSLVLAMQIMEITSRVILCFNLADEAKKKGIFIDTHALERHMNVPTLQTSSKDKASLKKLANLLERPITEHPFHILYPEPIEREITYLQTQWEAKNNTPVSSRFLAIKCLENDREFLDMFEQVYHIAIPLSEYQHAIFSLEIQGYNHEKIEQEILQTKYQYANRLLSAMLPNKEIPLPGKADGLLTGKMTAYPIMLLGLLGIFWLTIIGAQYPSDWLWNGLFSLEKPLHEFLSTIHCPETITHLLVYGVYRVVAWVISVMLPPMAIFFPLFTLLEDIGILPRIAFNMDHLFQKCRSCGKQALTMCMGFGCNAVGVTGCRIIRSPRERTIAILTNTLVPCNGRFPTIITLLTLFFVTTIGGLPNSITTAIELTFVILLAIAITLLCSWGLSKTLYKGMPSFYSLELPPYRTPKIGQVIIRSMMDRTLFVLFRSIAVAIPAGILLWLSANITVDHTSLLQYAAQWLQPLGEAMGLDGVILLAFILGSPANEIVIPIILMSYNNSAVLSDYSSWDSLKQILIQNGWTLETALCMIIFMLFHFPCTTTLITIYKETKSFKTTLLSFFLPTTIGILLCMMVHGIWSIS